VPLHSKAVLERFVPEDFCLKLIDEQDAAGLVAVAHCRFGGHRDRLIQASFPFEVDGAAVT
jgi:hypothetical protein